MGRHGENGRRRVADDALLVGRDWLRQRSDRHSVPVSSSTGREALEETARSMIAAIESAPHLSSEERTEYLELVSSMQAEVVQSGRFETLGDQLAQELLANVEMGLRRHGVTWLPPAVIATTAEPAIQAQASSILDAATIELTGQILILAKEFGHLVTVGLIESIGDTQLGVRFQDTPAAVSRARNFMRGLLQQGIPSNIRASPLALDGRQQILSQAICTAVEVFCVAHEFGHLLQEYRHEFEEKNPKSPICKILSYDDHELGADTIGVTVLLATLREHEPWMLRALAPILFFELLAALEKAGMLPKAKDHPASAERADHAAQVVSMINQRAFPAEEHSMTEQLVAQARREAVRLYERGLSPQQET